MLLLMRGECDVALPSHCLIGWADQAGGKVGHDIEWTPSCQRQDYTTSGLADVTTSDAGMVEP